MHRRDSRLVAALARWQHSAGRYWPYICATPFLAHGIRPVSVAAGKRQPCRLVDLLVDLPVDPIDSPRGDGRIAAFVDLPPRLTLPATPFLNERGWIVVPVIQRWVEEPAVLDCRLLVHLLVVNGDVARLPRPSRGVVFLLDGDRDRPVRSREPGRPDRAFDNRYAYPSCRFPAPSFLLRDGVNAVYWLSRSGVAPDLQDYVAALTAACLEPRLLSVQDHQVRLGQLEPSLATPGERRALSGL